MEAARKMGAVTHTVIVHEKNIKPCVGCGTCEKTGFCAIRNDDMALEVFSLLRRSDMIVMASPVYFYHVPSHLKCLIDRCQTLWSRKYRLKLKDPKSEFRLLFLLSVGATRGKNLFEGTHLTMNVLGDAIGADYQRGLTYRGIESRGEIEKVKSIHRDIRDAARSFIQPMIQKPRILFLCKGNTCRSPMAAAFAQHSAGVKLEALSAGIQPEIQGNPVMVEAMQEKGLDMAFHTPEPIESALRHGQPDIIVTLGRDVKSPELGGVRVENWDLDDPYGQPVEMMRRVRDEIEKNVQQLISIF
jgi:protein-tyrosine-phosphatase/multimeric flavodoxin WrbA